MVLTTDYMTKSFQDFGFKRFYSWCCVCAAQYRRQKENPWKVHFRAVDRDGHRGRAGVCPVVECVVKCVGYRLARITPVTDTGGIIVKGAVAVILNRFSFAARCVVIGNGQPVAVKVAVVFQHVAGCKGCVAVGGEGGIAITIIPGCGRGISLFGNEEMRKTGRIALHGCKY